MRGGEERSSERGELFCAVLYTGIVQYHKHARRSSLIMCRRSADRCITFLQLVCALRQRHFSPVSSTIAPASLWLPLLIFAILCAFKNMFMNADGVARILYEVLLFTVVSSNGLHCLKHNISNSVSVPISYSIDTLLLSSLQLISQLPNLCTGTSRICNFYFVGAFFSKMLSSVKKFTEDHHHHHHQRISSRRKSYKTSGPLCVTC